MIRGTENKPGRITFSYSTCYGMCYHTVEVDKEWFYAQDLEHLSEEKLDKMAFADRDNSKADGISRWYGLG